jgi:hypothetical protein
VQWFNTNLTIGRCAYGWALIIPLLSHNI